MASITKNSSLRDLQDFVNQVYGPGNRKHFIVEEMLTNISRFSMRGLKGVRKNDTEKTALNLVIAMSWYTSLMSQICIDIEDIVWKRFPYLCSYCGECPCACKSKRVKKRVELKANKHLKPKTIHEVQAMFNDIYPAKSRTLEHASIHMAEEVGELSEAVLRFRGHHREEDFEQVKLEAADLYSCFMGVFNSLNFDYHKELMKDFYKGCHVCHQTPCVCKYDFVINFRS